MRLLTSILITAACASAATLSFVPPFQQAFVGGTATVQVAMEGLDGAATLGGFDIRVGYDPLAHTPIGVNFGVALGDPSLFESLGFVDNSTPGELRVAMTSLLDPALLAASQPASFVLFDITFRGLLEGITPVTFLSLDLVDENALPLQTGIGTGAIEYIVPEPGTLWAAGAALVLLGAWRRR